ncbi:hypothetical protein [Bradyrhizobium sp. 139]|uniref:hypothetical protein n=1 Tax=Bradyrhizobium sp. 139 TaxID=2782616 RepID=UPI001FFAE84E|nr:hypothetical protein [Bradyrhizobium sp. 139]
MIRDAMSREAVVGLARVVLSSCERVFLVEPTGGGLRGIALRFAHELWNASEYFSEIPEVKLPSEMMKRAQHIIRTKSTDFDPALLEDHYRSALQRILRKKQARPRAAASHQTVAREHRQPYGCAPAQHRRRTPGKARARRQEAGRGEARRTSPDNHLA